MRRFSDVIEDLELRDLPLLGVPYTWSRGLNNLSKSRLDRFLVSEEWESLFGCAIQSVLPRPISDHSPILLDVGGVKWGPSPFRFELMWLKTEGFKETLRNWWQGMSFEGSTSFVMMQKLKELKGVLKTWNKEVFGHVACNKNEALRQITHWDAGR